MYLAKNGMMGIFELKLCMSSEPEPEKEKRANSNPLVSDGMI